MNDLRLEEIPAAMADAVRPSLAAATLDGYARFLSAMAHYTRHSGLRLRHAAERTAPGLAHDLFAQLAKEEHGHHLLAEADLATFGVRPDAHEPPSVTAFHDRWMRNEDPGRWLGALYALERVGAHLQRDAAQNLGRLGLRRDQARFVLVHLDVDVEHGARSAEACATWPDGPVVLGAAREAARFWVGLHVEAFAGVDARGPFA
jgi:Iron-containing redox enzyme